MFKPIIIQRLSIGSVFKLLAIGMSMSLIPFSLIMGILAFFGYSTVHWNGEPLTGATGLAASPFIGAFVALFLTVMLGAMCALGLWLFSKIRPIELVIKEINTSALGTQA